MDRTCSETCNPVATAEIAWPVTEIVLLPIRLPNPVTANPIEPHCCAGVLAKTPAFTISFTTLAVSATVCKPKIWAVPVTADPIQFERS